MKKLQFNKQKGFSLIELMVGLVIGLLVSLVIANVFSVYEQQKRTTTGNSDAQTNGSIALYSLQRDVAQGGFGLPVYDMSTSPFNCPQTTTVDHDGTVGTPNPATAAIGLSPVVIVDGGALNGRSDTVSIHMGDAPQGGASVPMLAGTAANVAQVNTSLGCNVNDVALIVNDPGTGTALTCSMARVTACSATGVSPANVTLSATTNVAVGNGLACLGAWNEIQYNVNNNNQLTKTGAITVAGGVRTPNVTAVPLVSDIVDMQAQYGISNAPTSNQVTQWVNATGVWAAPPSAGLVCSAAVANRNCIKAVRVAVVARNGLLERANVTSTCSSTTAANPTGLCAWDGSVAGQAPAINLTSIANWQRYRYRVYETIIPLKNVIWSASALK